MDEATWVTSKTPWIMLKHLLNGKKTPTEQALSGFPIIKTGPLDCVTDRKLWLFCAAVERHWVPRTRKITSDADLTDVHLLEHIAEGRSTDKIERVVFSWTLQDTAAESAVECLRIHDLSVDIPKWANLLREVFGNPFDPVSLCGSKDHGSVTVRPHCAACQRLRTPLITSMAQQCYDGDWDTLGPLSDALEDAGCCDETILRHLRGGCLRVKGCWVVDLIKGRK